MERCPVVIRRGKTRSSRRPRPTASPNDDGLHGLGDSLVCGCHKPRQIEPQLERVEEDDRNSRFAQKTTGKYAGGFYGKPSVPDESAHKRYVVNPHRRNFARATLTPRLDARNRESREKVVDPFMVGTSRMYRYIKVIRTHAKISSQARI